MRILIIGIVSVLVAVVVALAFVVPPYLSWLSYEPAVIITEDEEPPLEWDYPWDRGLEISVSWSASIFEKDAWPYATAINPATGVKVPADLQAPYVAFDIADVPAWIPTYTEFTPEKPGFWDYFDEYYSPKPAEIVPEDTLAFARITCLFTWPDGTKWWLPIGDLGSDSKVWPFYEAGDYSDSFVMNARTYSGTYTWTLAIIASSSATIAWDTVEFTYVNRYE